MSFTFSNCIKCSGIVAYSPDGRYFAIAKGVEMKVYEVEGLKVVMKQQFCDFIEHLEWSNDSSMVLIGLFKRGIVELKSIAHPEWVCRIEESLAGIAYSRWLPDNRHIFTVNEFNIKLTIWSLIDKSLKYINYPKYARKGLCFTSSRNFMALIERINSKDSIGIYFLGEISLITKFDIATSDVQDIAWTADNTAVLAYDNPIECKFYVYSLTGQLCASIEPYKYALGIRNLAISPNGHFIAIGCYDQSLKVYNSISYTNVISFEHCAVLNDNKVNYFKEEEMQDSTGRVRSKYQSLSLPVTLESIKPQSTEPNPRMGVKQIEYSFDSNFIATRNENMPNVLWVWDMLSLSLHTVIIQLQAITDFKWSPNNNMLVICTENCRLYYFTLETIYSKELSIGFISNKVNWSPNGTKFILSNNSAMLVADLGIVSPHSDEEDEGEGEGEGEEEAEAEGEHNEENQLLEEEEDFNNFKPNPQSDS